MERSMILRVLGLLLWISLVSANIDSLRFYETLHSTQIRHRIVKRDVSSDLPHVRQLEFNSLGRHFHLYLQKKRSLLSSSFKVVAIDSNDKQRTVSLNDRLPYEGYLIGEVDTSEVHVMWEDDDNLMASIYTNNDVIFVEPSWRHLPRNDNFSMIIYRKSDVKVDSELGKSFCGYIDANKEFNLPKAHDHYDPGEYQSLYHTYNQHRATWNKHPQSTAPRKKRASDPEPIPAPVTAGKPQALPLTYRPVHTTCRVLLVADYLFFKNMGRSSLSKTSSYLIGLLDRVDAIYRKTNFGGYVGMGFEIKEILIYENYTKSNPGHAPHYNVKLPHAWNTKLLLEAFSRYRSYSNFCLVHLFTYQAFTGGVLGLAYIGSPRIYSVGGICSPDYYKNRTRLYLNTGWSSALNRHNRRLLTQEADLVTTHGHNWGSEHDPDTNECSPSAFSGGKYIMYTYSVSGYDANNKIFSPCSRRSIGAVLQKKAQPCFSAKGKSFCGNSHVEGPDEECDVGPEGLKGTDECCADDCHLKPNAKCSDMNDLCCLNCQYASNTTICHEHSADVPTCEGTAYCTGQSATCPKPEHMADNSSCLERGSCKAGRCIPLCETKGLVSCICDQVNTACLWCCKKNHNSTCVPYVDDPVTNITSNLPDGMPCIQGSCLKGECQRQTYDLVQRIWKIIENITPDQLVAFMRANIVGTVIILSLCIWIPVSCIVSWRDRETARAEKEHRDWLFANNDALYRPQDAPRVRPIRGLSRQRQSTAARHSFATGKPLATNM